MKKKEDEVSHHEEGKQRLEAEESLGEQDLKRKSAEESTNERRQKRRRMEKLVGWGEVSGDQVEVGQDNSLETWRASETLPGGWSVRQSPCATEEMTLLGGVWRQEKIPEGWSIENNDLTDTPVYSPATQTNNRKVSENKAKPTEVKTKPRKRGGG